MSERHSAPERREQPRLGPAAGQHVADDDEKHDESPEVVDDDGCSAHEAAARAERRGHHVREAGLAADHGGAQQQVDGQVRQQRGGEEERARGRDAQHLEHVRERHHARADDWGAANDA